MKYLILGTGGTGGCIGGYLANSGKDVAFVARGPHLKAMRENGLIVHSSRKGEINLKDVRAFSGDDELEKFDVIFVCVKGYSLYETLSAIKKASHEKTVVIPILNALNAGEKLREALPGISVLDGCVYLSAYISVPGEITQGIKIFRVVFGLGDNVNVPCDLLYKIREDLLESGIEGIVSNNIKRDIFRKFSFTSAYAAAGAYFDAAAGEFQKDGECREMFVSLLKELQRVAQVLYKCNQHLTAAVTFTQNLRYFLIYSISSLFQIGENRRIGVGPHSLCQTFCFYVNQFRPLFYALNRLFTANDPDAGVAVCIRR